MLCVNSEFYNFDVLKEYKYYWCFELGVSYGCFFIYDFFVMMVDCGKKYGYIVVFWEEFNMCFLLF